MFENLSEMLVTGGNRLVALFMKDGGSVGPLYRQAESEIKHWTGDWSTRGAPYYFYEAATNSFVYFNDLSATSFFVLDIAVSYFHVDCDSQEVFTAIKGLKSKNNLWFTFSRKEGFKVLGPIK